MVRSDITLEEVATHNESRQGRSCWTIIHNEVYDISGFFDEHPGGDILRTAAGRDASGLVESSHSSSAWPKVMSLLKSKCPHVGTLQQKATLHDDTFYTTLKSRVDKHLKQKGKSRHWPVALTTIELVVTLILYFVAVYFTSVYASYKAAIALGIVTGRLGFLMHMGNHGAHSNKWLNMIHGRCMDLIGSNHHIWRHEHQVAHHLTPNEYGKDNDCVIGSPVLRMHPKLERFWWHKFQPIVTCVGMSTGFFKWYLADPSVLLSGVVGNIVFWRDPKDMWSCFFWKAQWAVLHVFLPIYLHGFFSTDFWGPLVVFMVVGAHYLEQIFVVNHIQSGLVPPVNVHWSHKQVLGSSNWSSGSVLANFVSGGLNHQIEHHLFPSISYYLYPEISPIVRQTCKEFNLQYTSFKNFPTAWWKFMTYLAELGSEHHHHL